MAQSVIDSLEQHGVSTSFADDIPVIPIGVDREHAPVVLGQDVPIACPDNNVVSVRLKSIPDLFTGTRVPPCFAEYPTNDYLNFFTLIERTAVNYCVTTKRVERDVEFEALYNHLRRRPSGHHFNPLFSYLQAAVRLYMSLRDVSQAEFEAVVDC